MMETSTDPENWCVYLILCEDKSLYCGISNRPAERFRAHCSGKGAKYTRLKKPLAMRLISDGMSRSEALRSERATKKLTADKKRALWTSSTKFAANDAV